MTLASGGDIKIGDYEFDLDENVEEHYGHELVPVVVQQGPQTIVGIERQALTEPNLYWGYDDWSGGEGNTVYDPEEPEVYHTGKVNPRTPGYVTAPPTRASATVTAEAAPTDAWTTAAGGSLWVVTNNAVDAATGEGSVWYTTDLTNFTVKAVTLAAWTTSDIATAVTSDQKYLYVATVNGANREIHRLDTSAGTTTWVSAVAGQKYAGLAYFLGKIYGWTGQQLWEFDGTATVPITQAATNKVFSTLSDALPTTFYADIVAAETSLVMFIASEGETQVYEYKDTVGRNIWNPPRGFTAKAIAHSLGVIYLAGLYNQKAALFAMSLVSRQPIFLGYIRESDTLAQDVAEITGTHGAQVLLSENTQRVFYIYDAELDALSELDELTAGTPRSVITFKDRKAAVVTDGTTTVTVYNWTLDNNPSGTWQFDTPVYDFGLPQEDKVLLGVHITSEALGAAETITVSYNLDEAGWTATTALESGSVNYVSISTTATTKSFRQLRIRIAGTGAAKLFSFVVRAQVKAYEETWDLALKIRDEVPRARVDGRQVDAPVLRDYILSNYTTKSLLTFLDGYRKGENDYSTHTVVIDGIRDIIERNGEGAMMVRLRRTSP
jgi:hypothetical protein